MTTQMIDEIVTDVVLRRVLRDDADQLICYDGTGQYTLGGISACGLAALNFARIVFERENAGFRDAELVLALISKATMLDAISICRQWPDNLHVEVETISKAPIFQHSLKEVTCHYGMPGFDKFKEVLRDLEGVSVTSKASAVAVITRPPEIIACARTSQNVFAIFDSHNRPEHPSGAGLFLTTSLGRAARHLHNLLYVDPELYADSGFQWQAQLLANFSAHIFISPGSMRFDLPELTQSLLECSLEVLRLRAHVKDLRTQNQALTEDNESLEEELCNVEDERRRIRLEFDFLRASQIADESNRRQSNALQIATPTTLPSTPKGKGRADTSTNAYVAWQLQYEFDNERAQIDADRMLVQSSSQATFDCTVCLDTQPIDFATTISGCSHTTCRNCLREHIATTLRDHRYPIFCPACVGDSAKAEITHDVIFNVGIKEEDFIVFEELQMSAVSILLHCRECKESVFVDRIEYQESKIVTCPLPRCTHAWCKFCQVTITPNVVGPPHSCDGSSELEHLMKQRGWKYCPGCKTPVMKESGCNHMICMSPGCNTHFCYVCGDSILRSAMRNDIRNAVSAHYRRCTLFEVPR